MEFLDKRLTAWLQGRKQGASGGARSRTGTADSRRSEERARLCGNLNDYQCNAYTSAQAAANGQIASSMSELRSVQSALQSGRPLSERDKAVVDRLEWSLGPGAGRDPAIIRELLEIGGEMTGQIGKTAATTEKWQDPKRTAPQAQVGGPGQVRLYDGFFADTPRGRAQALAHEAHHQLGGKDVKVATKDESIPAYGRRNIQAQARALRNPRSMMRRPDAITFAFGFERDDD